MEPADSNVPEEEKSKDPNSNQEEPKTGSAFDFLNEQLDQEEDLSKTKQALDSPQAKELINKYGLCTVQSVTHMLTPLSLFHQART